MPRNWQDITDDEILNFEGPQTAEIARYERIMQKRSIDAMLGPRDRLTGLGDTIYKMHQGFKDTADEAFKLYELESQAQARRQKSVMWLTIVIPVSTVLYTGITAASVYATRQANQIQRDALDWRERLVCPRCRGRQVDIVATGTRR
jgi:hypothetical protein